MNASQDRARLVGDRVIDGFRAFNTTIEPFGTNCMTELFKAPTEIAHGRCRIDFLYFLAFMASADFPQALVGYVTDRHDAIRRTKPEHAFCGTFPVPTGLGSSS